METKNIMKKLEFKESLFFLVYSSELKRVKSLNSELESYFPDDKVEVDISQIHLGFSDIDFVVDDPFHKPHLYIMYTVLEYICFKFILSF